MLEVTVPPWAEVLEDAVRLGRLSADSPADDIVVFLDKHPGLMAWCEELLAEHRDVDEVVDRVCLHLKVWVRMFAARQARSRG
jgi:hypothetical protein